MVHKRPEMVSRIKIGNTIEDNPLYVLKVKIIQELAIFIIVGKHEFKSCSFFDTFSEFWYNEKSYYFFWRTFTL